MNPQQAQAQPGQAGQANQQGMRLLRPEQLRNLPVLNNEEKTKYEEGLRTLWNRMRENGQETVAHQQAKSKIIEFSRMVYDKIRHLQERQRQAQQQQQQTAQQQLNQAQNPQGQGNPQGGAQPQQPAQGNQAQIAAQKQQVPANRPQGPAAPTGAATGAAAGQRPAQIPASIMDHVNKLPWQNLNPPAQLPAENVQKWASNVRQRYLQSLLSMEQARQRIVSLEKVIQERAGQISPEDMKKYTDSKEAAQKAHADSSKFVTGIRTSLQPNGQNAGAQANQQNRPQPAAIPGQANPAHATNHPMQAETASVNAAMNAAKNQQLAAAQRSQGTPGQPQAQTQAQQQPAPPKPQTPGAPSGVPQSQPAQPPAAPQPQVKTEPGTQPQPSPINTTALASATAGHLPTAGTPKQASARAQTPQSATAPASATAPGGAARPLTHAAAVNRANSSTNLTAQPAASSNGVANTTPGSTALATSASQPGHPHAHPQTTSATAITAKMPIPKNLPERATAVPSAVSTGGGIAPGRPTYSGGNGIGGGVMSQPVIAKTNNMFTFDADSDHVLSKKKLDELVRQVCGGGPAGTEGNYLTPDVEDSVLQVADNFVDNVLHTACRLAKERGSSVLETRDLQIAIERGYNIRIPGYSSEELRTVRKVAPNNSWIAKMSAVQAAKVMPGAKDDK